MENKRGQGLSVNAIILIVLGVLVLVFMVLGFTVGFNKILPFLGGGNNVDDIIGQCNSACASNSAYAYCSQNRSLKTEGSTMDKVNCSYLANNAITASYGFQNCSSINACP